MKCAMCSAGVLAPLVEGGVSAHKIAERARRVTQNPEITAQERAYVHMCADTLEWLAAELWRAQSRNVA